MIKIISQHIDTLKLHFYATHSLSDEEIKSYNELVDELKTYKSKAMEIKSNNKDERVVKTTINDIVFHIRSSAISGFSVVAENGDISIALKKIGSSFHSPIIKVEFRSEYLLRFGYIKCINEVNQLISSFLPHYKIKVSEIHLATDIQGYEFYQTDYNKIVCRNRTKESFEEIDKSFYGTNIFTGMSFGKDSFMLRIYNKTFHINRQKDKGFIKVLRWELNPDYDSNKNVWRIEFQLRREYLKTLIGKDGILDGFEVVLNSIPDIWKHCVERFRHLDLKDEYSYDIFRGYRVDKHGNKIPLNKETIRKRYYRANLSNLWLSIQSFNNFGFKELEKFEEIEKPQVEYVVNAFKGVVSTFIKLNRGEFDKEKLITILLKADQKEYEKTGFSILHNAYLKTANYIEKKREHFYEFGLVDWEYEDYKNKFRTNLKEVLENIEDPVYRRKFFDAAIQKGLMIYGSKD